eukprot:3935336-Rhodomonas_salina.1
MLWSKTLREFLLNLGFRAVGYEGSTFTLEKDWMLLILVTYVDNLQLIFDRGHAKLAEWFKNEFSKQFKITNEGDLTWHLGVHYVRASETESRKPLSALKRNLKPRDTPAVAGEQLVKAPKEELLNDAEAKLFREQLGAIMYLATMTRPDLSSTTGSLAKYMQNPCRQHQEALKQVFHYLSGTRGYGITYRSGDATVLVGYSDADWSNAEKSKSVSGLVFTLH